MTDLDDQNIVSINISHDYNAPPYDEASGFDSDVQTLAEGSYSYDVKLGNPAVPELAESAAGSSEESSTCRDLSDEDHDVEFSLQENRVGSPLNLDIQTTAMVDKELGNLTEPPVMTMQLPLGIVKNQKTGITSRPALGEPVLFETSRKGSFKHTYDKWWTCWALIIVLIVSTIVGVYMFAFDTSNETLTGATNSNSQQGITGSVRVPATVVPAATSNSATMFNSTTLTTAPKTRAPTKAPTTSTPSLAPSSSPSTLESLRIEAIIRAASREPHLLDTSSSWQALSVDWMQTEDQIETVSAGKLIQRYALVLLDLALHNSSKPKFALAKSDECFWWGVICNMNETESRQYNPVVSLTWARDGLIGQIPQDVALLTNLTKLDLAENHITGQIPAGLYNLTVLKHLYLFDNKMEGTISTMIGNMKALTRVMLGDNNFHGEIPTEIGSSNSTLNGPKPLGMLDEMIMLDSPFESNQTNTFRVVLQNGSAYTTTI